MKFLMQLFTMLIAVFLITNTFGWLLFGDRSDTSVLHFEDAAMIPEILHPFSPNLEIKFTSFLRTIRAENLSINTRYMYIICCSSWQNMPKTSEVLSLTKSGQSEWCDRKHIGRKALNFTEKSYQF